MVLYYLSKLLENLSGHLIKQDYNQAVIKQKLLSLGDRYNPRICSKKLNPPEIEGWSKP